MALILQGKCNKKMISQPLQVHLKDLNLIQVKPDSLDHSEMELQWGSEK